MEYAIIYLFIGVLITGLYHKGATTSKFPVQPTLMDLILVNLFWPIPVGIIIYTILHDLFKG